MGRIPDGPPAAVMFDAPVLEEIPDVSGTFLIGLSNDLLASVPPIQFLSTQTVDRTGGGYMVTLSFQPLDKTTRFPVGTAAIFGPVNVSSTGEFTATLPGELTIPAEADTLLPAPIVSNSVVITGHILSVDGHCGTLDGNVTAPIPADLGDSHTTYAAIRVTDTTPANLPAPQKACP